MTWKKLNIGDPVIYSWNDFDGSGSIPAIITEKTDDHAIATADGMHLWIDQDTQKMFKKSTFCEISDMILNEFFAPWDIEPEYNNEVSAMLKEKGISAVCDDIRNYLNED